ncbi:MAG: chromosomal replication initiator protein DnaA [Simkaniaceae bacterium]
MKEWTLFLAEKEKIFGKTTVDKWLRTLKILSFDACNLYLEASDTFQVSWFEEYIKPIAKKEFFNANGNPISIHIKCQEKADNHKKTKAASQQPSFVFDTLDPSSNFETFLETSENFATLSIFKKILEESSEKKQIVNPVYLYGQPGSGKTHLLMSAASYLRQQGLQIAYVRADTFTSHLVSAFRLGTIKEFRQIYRMVDVLIIDDVHLFSRRVSTGEELFHTFNDFHSKGKLIILSSRFAPSLLEEIEERLVSRFEWGMLLKLSVVKKKDLLSLARLKCRHYDFALDETMLHQLINIFTSPSSLTNAINALVLRLHGEEASQNPNLNRINDLIANQNAAIVSPEKIAKKVAETFGIPVKDLLGKSQSRECTLPRQIAMYLCRQLLEMSFPRIGAFFSRDHSTVITSVKQISDKVARREIQLLQLLNEITKALHKNP